MVATCFVFSLILEIISKAPFKIGTRVLFKTLRSKYFSFTLALGYVAQFCIRCIRFSGRIRSLQNSRHAHFSDATECNPNYRNTTNIVQTSYNVQLAMNSATPIYHRRLVDLYIHPINISIYTSIHVYTCTPLCLTRSFVP